MDCNSSTIVRYISLLLFFLLVVYLQKESFHYQQKIDTTINGNNNANSEVSTLSLSQSNNQSSNDTRDYDELYPKMKLYLSKEYVSSLSFPNFSDSLSNTNISVQKRSRYRLYNIHQRKHRFPTKEQRVKLYMLNWYNGNDTCNQNTNTKNLTSKNMESQRRRIRYGKPYKETEIIRNDKLLYQSNKTTISEINEQVVTSTFIKMWNVEQIPTPEVWDVRGTVESNVIFYLDTELMKRAASNDDMGLEQSYSSDIVQSMLPSMERIGWDTTDESSPPILLQYGDSNHCVRHSTREIIPLPVIKKFRHAVQNQQTINRILRSSGNYALDHVSNTRKPNPQEQRRQNYSPSSTSIQSVASTEDLSSLSIPFYQPIIWKLNTRRHYAIIEKIDKLDTTPYQNKKNIAIFRGAMNGHHHWSTRLSDEDNCRRMQRCNLVLLYRESSFVDASITGKTDVKKHRPASIKVLTKKLSKIDSAHIEHDKNNENPSRNVTSPDEYTEIVLKGSNLSIEDLLQYKIQIMIEGNDVSSGLKWALYSSSVVIMPYPVTVTTWAMEELLEPYVHFVPIRHDLSDLESAVQWILSHEREAMYISYRATLWIKDLLFHPNSQTDDTYIQDEILKHYRTNFEATLDIP